MSRDPTHYPDPERLDPERFLLNGQLNPDVRDPTTFVFGFGRRCVDLFPHMVATLMLRSGHSICPGRIFAESSLFITCASILHALDVSAPLDASGALRTLEMKAASLAVA